MKGTSIEAKTARVTPAPTIAIADVKTTATSVLINEFKKRDETASDQIYDTKREDAKNKAMLELFKALKNAEMAIEQKNKEIDGEAGLPVGQIWFGKGDGYSRRFQNGVIYLKPPSGPYWVHGAILAKYETLGAEGGWLGYPTTDELTTPDGAGRYNHFERGSIYWTSSTGAHEIHGAILEKWSSLGFERSFLGYPVSDEQDLGVESGRYSNFQKGQIAWTPTSGADVSSSSFSIRNGGIRPQGLPGDATPEVRRRVVVSAHMDITDDESLASNEHGIADQQTEGFVTNKQPKSLLTLVGRAGGEVRIELSVDASATTDGDVGITGIAKLFEGTSDQSDDLDGTTPISFAVPRDGFITQTLTVRNTAEGAGDFADIVLVVSNFAA